MIEREMAPKLRELAGQYPIVSVSGPRQSGKTTLVRSVFSEYRYVSFENPEVRDEFEMDPRMFLRRYDSHVIFDEAQREPDLFSYLQGIVDERGECGQFVLTGSQNFLLMKSVSQSLAGRVALFTLLPLSYEELSLSGRASTDELVWLYRGGYPRLFNGADDVQAFFTGYVQTYLERDVRGELGVRSLSAFRSFTELCALRVGQLLNISSLASDCGIAVNTAREWLSILEASHIIYLLRPYFSNKSKRLVKTPKLYFLDTGLAAYLMGLESPDDILDSGFRGQLFECAVISEVLKRCYARARAPRLSFWRDAKQREIDLLIERGPRVVRAIECKASTTFNPKFFDMLNRISEGELGLDARSQAVVYGGDYGMEAERGDLVPFSEIGRLL